MSKHKMRHTKVAAVAASFFRSVGTRYSLKCEEALRKGSYGNAMPVPDEYSDPISFRNDYACYTFLRKLRLPGDVQRLTSEAVDRFKSVDARVRQVNRRLESAVPNVEGVISDARRKIQQILGDFDYSCLAYRSGWGPGATASIKAQYASVDQKVLEKRLSVTHRALPYARAYMSTDYHWLAARGLQVDGPVSLLADEFNRIESSRFTTVDKDYKTRRAIDIQPTLNLFLQKGVGKAIRGRLKRIGIDLDDQSRNQYLAEMAYKLKYATIDLANASDTVSTSLVRLLLPDDWFRVLYDLRTFHTDINGEMLYLHKFSAMGNGYTFELESLIFFALCWAVVRCELGDYDNPIGVYGDDIVVPQHAAARLIEVLEACGFEVNSEKSFTSGPFYESCGKHYFMGVDVTPFYQKEPDIDSYHEALRLANRIYRWALREPGVMCIRNSVAVGAWELSYSNAACVFSEWSASTNLQRTKFGRSRQWHQLPTILPDDSDDGLICPSRGRSRSAWKFQTFKHNGGESALLREELASIDSRPSQGAAVDVDSQRRVASYGFVSLRDSGKYHYVLRRR